MSQVVKTYALFLGSAFLMFAGGLQGLLLSVRGAEEQFSLLALGLIGTGWSIGFISGSVLVPTLVMRVGHIRAFAVMAAVGAITILLNSMWVDDIGWIFLRIFSGFCFAGAAMVVESWLGEISDNKNRGTIFSIYVMVNMASLTLGQLAISLTGVQGYIPFIIGAIAFIAALLPTAMSTQHQPRPLSSAKIDIGLLYRTSPIAVIASLSVGIANGTFGTLAPVYGYKLGFAPADIAYLTAIPIVLGALAQVPFGRISDMIDRRTIIVIASSLAAAAGIGLVLLNPDPGLSLYILFGLYGFTAFPIQAVAVAHANDFAEDGDFGSIAAGMLLILGIGMAIGPILASFAMNIIGPVGLFIVTATFHGALAITAIIRMRIRPIDDDEPRTRFRIMQLGKFSTTATVTLDPRADDDSNKTEML